MLKALGVGAVGVGLQTGAIPAAWVKPVIDTVVSPANAQIMPTPSASPMAMPVAAEPVSVAPAGFIAVVTGLLGYLGIKSLKRTSADARENR
ncbi:MAG: hypothetical protein R3E54_16185 [Halioglobus sp.]